MILPGATLGMLGGGQLGRMFVHAATSMGYRVNVLDPNATSPAGEVAQLHLQANYDDKRVLDAMAQECSVITTEFENVPADVLKYLEATALVCPNSKAVETAQSRLKEKNFAQSLNISCAEFHQVNCEQDIQNAFEKITEEQILKTTTLGYDGKGQVVVKTADEAIQAWKNLNQVECILEQRINLKSEISVVIARSTENVISFFPVAENVHRDGILFTSTVPANINTDLQELAKANTQKIAEKLNYFGILAVEYFVDQNDHLYFNEMAPRTHNSGHYTLDACYTSQFEQQVRAICGLPLGNSQAHSAVTMVNVLGDLWHGGTPDWCKILESENVKLHLYGKREARVGRKMGHYNVLAKSAAESLSTAQEIFSTLLVAG